MNKIEFISYLIEVGEINQEVIDRSMEVSDFPLARKLLLKIEGFIENILRPKNSAELDLAKGELLSNCILNNREIKQEGIKFVDEIVNAVRLKNNFTTKNTYYSEDVIDRGIQENLPTLISLFNERQQEILILRFGLYGEEPLKLDEIARKLNVSRKSVRQIEAEAMLKLRFMNEFIENKKNKKKEKNYKDTDFFELSSDLFEKEEYEKSMNKISKAIKLNASEPEYFYLRGLLYIKFKNFDKALKDANNAIALNANQPKELGLNANQSKYLVLKQDSLKFLTLKKIYEYFDNCEFEKTILQCNEAISSNNSIPEFFYYRGLAKWKSNMVHQNKSILNDFDKAITLDPDNSEILTTRGILKMEIDNNGAFIKSAIKDFNLAIEFDDNCIDAYAQRANARLYENNCEGAFDDINAVMRLDPHNKYNYFDELEELKTDIEKREIELLGEWGYIYLIENITSTCGTHKIGATQNIRTLKRNLKGDKIVVLILCKNYLKMEERYKSLYRKESMKNANNYNLEDIHVKNIIHSMNKLSIPYSGEYIYTKKEGNTIIYPSSWS